MGGKRIYGVIMLDNIYTGQEAVVRNITDAARCLNCPTRDIKKLIATGKANRKGWVADEEIEGGKTDVCGEN